MEGNVVAEQDDVWTVVAVPVDEHERRTLRQRRLRRSGRRDVDGQPELRIQFREHATDQRDCGGGTKILDS
jgi:hypothetical protein